MCNPYQSSQSEGKSNEILLLSTLNNKPILLKDSLMRTIAFISVQTFTRSLSTGHLSHKVAMSLICRLLIAKSKNSISVPRIVSPSSIDNPD